MGNNGRLNCIDMIPTTYGILQQKQIAAALIQVDTTVLAMTYMRYVYSNYCAINVTPDTIATTITKIDTGDGTAWATIVPTNGTGDYSFRARAMSNNNGTVVRTMTLRISDNAGIAASVDVTLYQYPNEIV